MQKCYCKVPHGNIHNNGIMCRHNGKFKETMFCSADEWCTGPFTQETAISLTATGALCEKGNRLRIK